MELPLLAASNYGIAMAIVVLFGLFLIVGWVIVQGTRAQLEWRKLVDRGDVSAITTLVGDEIDHWKTKRMPKDTDPAVWHGVQSAELLAADPDGVRVSATAEARYALIDGERREVSSALQEGMKVTAKLADMVMYDIPNARLGHVTTPAPDSAASSRRTAGVKSPKSSPGTNSTPRKLCGRSAAASFSTIAATRCRSTQTPRRAASRPRFTRTIRCCDF